MTGLQKKIILKALDRPECLTEWEYDFIDSLADKADDAPLTPRQSEILVQQIWPKVSRG